MRRRRGNSPASVRARPTDVRVFETSVSGSMPNVRPSPTGVRSSPTDVRTFETSVRRNRKTQRSQWLPRTYRIQADGRFSSCAPRPDPQSSNLARGAAGGPKHALFELMVRKSKKRVVDARSEWSVERISSVLHGSDPVRIRRPGRGPRERIGRWTTTVRRRRAPPSVRGSKERTRFRGALPRADRTVVGTDACRRFRSFDFRRCGPRVPSTIEGSEGAGSGGGQLRPLPAPPSGRNAGQGLFPEGRSIPPNGRRTTTNGSMQSVGLFGSRREGTDSLLTSVSFAAPLC